MVKRRSAHLLMVILVISWGLEYVFAKNALEAIDQMALVFFKYVIALVFIGVIKFFKERKGFIRKKDFLTFLCCAFTGEVLYFYCEYSAMDYLPVSLITILLAFVPVLSVIIERIVYKRATSKLLIGGIIVCVLGVALIIGVDIEAIISGKLIGYLLCLGAVVSWNIYNFMTASLGEKYLPLTLTFNQLTCTVLLSFPLALGSLPDPSQMTASVVSGVLYLGFISAGVGFLIYVYAIRILGPTPMAVYSNFLPVTATLFGWIFLHETIGLMQLFGGVVVIAAGCVVIREKGRLNLSLQEDTRQSPENQPEVPPEAQNETQQNDKFS